jgi:hypothetical protein
MTSRRRLPNRRFSETFAVEAQGMKFTATVSRFDDGSLAEICLTNHRAGSDASYEEVSCALSLATARAV